MDSNFPSFTSAEQLKKSKDSLANTVPGFPEIDNDILNLYSNNFDPILDSFDFPQAFDATGAILNTSQSSQPTNGIPPALSDISPAFNDIGNFTPAFDTDSTPGSSSISSFSPHSPSDVTFGLPSLSNATLPKSANSYSSSPSDLAVQEKNVLEKRKAQAAASGDASAESTKKQAIGETPSVASNSNSSSQKPPPRRPGRRIDPNEPENKRKAQNRAAQRAFRERKEKHLKELEDRVEELEKEAETANTENDVLRAQVERLQSELRKFKEGQTSYLPSSSAAVFPDNKFTFEFPFFQASKSTAKPDSDFKAQSESPDSLNSGKSTENVPDLTQSTPNSVSSVGPEPKDQDAFCDQLGLACGTKENPIPKYKTSNPFTISNSEISAFDTSFLSPKSDKPLQNSGSGAGAAPLSFDLDFLSNYNDQVVDTDFLSAFDTPVSNTTPGLNQFVLPTPEQPGVSNSLQFDKNLVDDDEEEEKDDNTLNNLINTGDDDEDDDTIPAPPKMVSCTAIWDRISSHPKFAELDIDGLCAELRTKAKCSENGVVLNEKDFNKVLSGFSR